MKNATKSMKGANRVKKTEAEDAKKVRTTISISGDLHRLALARMKELRRGSFSNYIENLVAADVPQEAAA